MKPATIYTLSVALFFALLTTGCYTQVKTVHTDRYGYAPGPADRESAEDAMQEGRQEAVERRMGGMNLQEDPNYLYGYEEGIWDGYEEGWAGAEHYYFLDYETRDWYRRYGPTQGSRFTHIHHHYHYGYPYSVWHSYHAYPAGWSSAFRLSFWFGSGYHYYDPWYYNPWYGYHSPHHWYRYPAYGFYGSPYYRSGFFHHRPRFSSEPSRTYTIRSSGLSGSGSSREQRSRSSAVQTTRSGSNSNSTGLNRRERENDRQIRSDTSSGSVERTRSVESSTQDRRTGNRAGETIRNRIESRSGDSDSRISAPSRSVEREQRPRLQSSGSSSGQTRTTIQNRRGSNSDVQQRRTPRSRSQPSVNSQGNSRSSSPSPPSRSSSRDRDRSSDSSSSGRSR